MAGGALPGNISITNMPTGRKALYPLILVTILFFLWGFAYGLLDVLNKHFQDVLHLSKFQTTALQVAYFGAYVVFPTLVGTPLVRKFGYKVSILVGLGLYIVGAILFWPCATYESFGGFVGATFVIASGLSSLEVVANTYVTVLGSPSFASFILNFAQSFNGLGSLTGPLLTSKFFFSAGNQNNLSSVKFIYLGIVVESFLSQSHSFSLLYQRL